MAKKIILIVLGVVLMLCGLGVAIPGTVLAALAGSDGRISSDYETISTNTPALVSEPADVATGTNLPTSGFGSTTITFAARDADQPLFLGVARAADVEEYLDGVAFDEVREFDMSPFRLSTTRRDGASSASPPEDETFWLASTTGDNPRLEWQVEESGNYRIVMMNADGSAGTSAEVQLGIEIEGLGAIGIGAIIVGVVSFLIGLALLIWGIRTKAPPRPATATSYPGSAPPPQPPPGPPPGQPRP